MHRFKLTKNLPKTGRYYDADDAFAALRRSMRADVVQKIKAFDKPWEETNMWQPIETAPKMTAILLYATGYYIGHYNTTNNKWWVTSDGTGTSAEKTLNSWNPPTHWMPLPDKP